MNHRKNITGLRSVAVIALLVAAMVPSCASGKGQTVALDYIRERLESTILRSWLACKPGDYVASVAKQGEDTIQCRQTFEGVNPDGTVRVKTERSGTAAMEASPFGGGEEVKNYFDSAETLTIAGRQLICNVLEGEGTKGRFKLWLSPEIPGAVVRMESSRGSLEVTDFKKSAE